MMMHRLMNRTAHNARKFQFARTLSSQTASNNATVIPAAISAGNNLENANPIGAATLEAHPHKPRVVVIGCGWAGFRAAQDLDKDKYDVQVISPRNHFLFTPLLPSTTVGTLEFRAIQEPVRTIPHIHYYQASVEKIDFEKNQLQCHDAFDQGYDFHLPYDILILAPGAETNTFNVKGVYDNPHVFFLKQLQDSRKIRNRLVECFERASSPALKDNEEEIKKLLTFVVVGGGPTSIEFASELYDFLHEDVSRWYPDLFRYCHVKIVEATGHILGSFNLSLVNYVETLFQSRKIQLLTHMQVKEVRGDVAVLGDGSEIPFGLMVWSTGIKQVPLIQQMDSHVVAKFPNNGRLMVDKCLRVVDGKDTSKRIGQGNVFAMGDCAGDAERPLPALAQVASQQAQYLSKLLNNINDVKEIGDCDVKANSQLKVFKYQHLGSMASVGEWKGVFDAPSDGVGPPIKGFLAFALWRAAYWTKQVSFVNKILIPMYWFKCFLFGRDISKF